MLILDKQKAVERVMAMTMVSAAPGSEQPVMRARGRTAHRIATYERGRGRPETVARPQAVVAPALEPKTVRRRRQGARAVGPSPA